MPTLPLRIGTRIQALLWSILGLTAIAVPAEAVDRIGADPTDSGGFFRFEVHNDIIGDHDGSGISGAWSVQKHTTAVRSWDDLQGVPDFMGRWGARLPTLTAEGLQYGASVSVNQIIQTPADLNRSELADWDVPYAGVLAAQFAWYAFNDDDLRAFQLTAGVVGPPSLAEPVQDLIHDIVGSDKAQGWDHQLSSEPVINLSYLRKKKLWRAGDPVGLSFDLAASGQVGIGNLLTHAGVGLEVRLGSNMPGGFLYLSEPAGLSLRHNARLAPANPSKPAIYASLALRANLVAHDLLLDGNTFEDSHSIDREDYVAHAIGGLHYETDTWAAHFTVAHPTNYVIYGDIPPSPQSPEGGSVDGNAMLAALTLEYLY